MQILNEESFWSLVEDMGTKYRFYRVIDNTIQAFIMYPKGWLWTTIERVDAKKILKLTSMGFIETKLTKEEIAEGGLD